VLPFIMDFQRGLRKNGKDRNKKQEAQLPQRNSASAAHMEGG